MITNTIRLGPLSVRRIGLGCMNLDHAYGPCADEEQGERILLGALDAGYDFFDTATLYGGGKNEERLGRVLKKHRNRLTLASKCGMAIISVGGKPTRVIDGRPTTLRAEIENSLRRLQTDVIDLYYLHRWDKKVPIEDSVGALSDLVRKGMIRAVGLSEVSAATLRKAHIVHPIAAVQTEYSLWTRNPEIAVLNTCRELKIGFVAFSPLARGFLGASLQDTVVLDAKDIRRNMPRFQSPHFEKNLALLPEYTAIAHESACTPAQLALAWLLNRDSNVVAIAGTTSELHMKENFQAKDLQLSEKVMSRLDLLINTKTVSGTRYDQTSMHEVDTESAASY
jgi:aryl-alcohol dehydrogenase-like predicted oxidoreductase